MKGKIGLVLVLAALWYAPRLSHPAVDIGKLKPAELVRIARMEDGYRMETESGLQGSGGTLEEAAAALKAGAPGEVLLETADFLLLTGEIRDWKTLCKLIRPEAKVCLSDEEIDLEAALAWLRTHPPEESLRILRVENGSLRKLIIKEGSGQLVP